MTYARIFAAALALTAASTPLQAQQTIQVGQTLRGTLSSSDPTMADGSHFDLYRIAGRSGQTLTITMRSDDFDTWLAVGRMSGGEFEAIETDDDGAGGTDSQLAFTFPTSGEYLIRANSLSSGETGGYTLSVGGGGAPPSRSDRSDMADGSVVEMLLDSAAVLMRQNGLTPRGQLLRGSVAQGNDTDVTVRLERAGILAFVGVCDANCSDVDLVVFNPDGSEAGSDLLPDDAPIVMIENAPAGTYRVRVSMPGCSATMCGFGVRAYGN